MMKKSIFGALALSALLAVGATAPASAAETKAAGSHASLPCDTCHKGGEMKAPEKETCLTCHESYAAVAKRTEKMNPNPHFSHRGEPQCSNCHSMHAKPRFECNDCHTFDIKMKGE